MNGPSEENAAPVGQSSDREAENRRKWVAENRDRIREINRLWRAVHLERARQLNRDSMRRATARRRRDAEVRARGRERAKRWREAHPDRKRAYQQRWVEQHREKVREYYNRYYESHRDEVNAWAAARRDADPDRAKQASKEWAERNKKRRAELQRIRRSDPQTYQAELETNAAAKHLKRRLSHTGLPPKQLHPATAAERRANEREADAYFNDLALPEHLRQLTVFAESLTEHMLENGARMREFAGAYAATRARMGLPMVSVENIVYSRAVEIITQRMRRVDLLTSRNVAAAVRSTQAEVPRFERQQQFDHLVKAVVAHAHRNSVRLAADAEMENQARSRRGRPRVPVGSLVAQLVTQEFIERLPTSSLTIDDARNAARIAGLHIATSLETRRDVVDDQVHQRSIG